MGLPVHRVTFCAESNLDSLLSAQSVTFCTKCSARRQTGAARRQPRRCSHCGVPDPGPATGPVQKLVEPHHETSPSGRPPPSRRADTRTPRPRRCAKTELHIHSTITDQKSAESCGSANQVWSQNRDECATRTPLHIHPCPGHLPCRETVGIPPAPRQHPQDECATLHHKPLRRPEMTRHPTRRPTRVAGCECETRNVPACASRHELRVSDTRTPAWAGRLGCGRSQPHWAGRRGCVLARSLVAGLSARESRGRHLDRGSRQADVPGASWGEITGRAYGPIKRVP